MTKKIVIVGGVAGGASCAARARRLSEEAEIILLERGPHVSFANCGLPYYVGGEIQERSKLIVQDPEALRCRFRLDVRVLSECIKIDRASKTVTIKHLETGRQYEESYDDLVLATGAAPLLPPIPGLKRDGHFVVRNVPDVDSIVKWIDGKKAARALVAGGGYIGLEMAEQLRRRGLKVTLVEALPQVMAPLDPEMAALLHKELQENGVELRLGVPVKSFSDPSDSFIASIAELASGEKIGADIVILGLGVAPDIGIAKDAGLETGKRGLRVNGNLRTSDPHIWAVGDAIEVRDSVTGEWAMIPLAGPANRQGRIVADNIFGRNSVYAGTQGTAVLRLFRLTAACTGTNEKSLKRTATPYQAVHLHPAAHASYFPGASPLALKILFSPADGKLLGAQAVGADGADKRIDVLATAIKAGMTVDDLAELELAYAPPFGSAKDPVNLAGMIGQNILRGDVFYAQWSDLDNGSGQVIIDVREKKERDAGEIPGSIHIPLEELRSRLKELPKDKELIVHCQTGQRSYFAARILMQHGFKVKNLSGSYKTWENATA